MSEQPARRRSAVWLMGCMVLAAWVACGVYRREVPAFTVARAVLRVPSATDLETLCRQPEIFQAAVESLEAEGDIYVVLEQGAGQSKLSGVLSAAKVTNPPLTTTADESIAAAGTISTETWELTYRTPLQDRALTELTALISVLQQRLLPVATKVQESDELAISQTELLEDQRQTLQQELEKATSESVSAPVDPSQLMVLKERVRTLQRSLIEAQSRRLQAEEEWRLVEQESRLSPRLDAVAAMLSAGPIQEAVLQIERQRKVSAELTRLNETEQRLGNVYGEKHPKLVELRGRFEQLLSDLGGWEQVLDESHVAERLDASLAQVLQLKQQHEADLRTQLELDQGELLALNQLTEHRAGLKAQLEQLDRELVAGRTASLADVAQGPAFALQPPELTAADWYSDLTLLMAYATSAGLISGWILHRTLFSGEPRSTHVPIRNPVTPVFTPAPPETQLDLAQRRALRQARLQQIYAS